MMAIDRAEQTGLSIAVIGHIVLIAALSVGIASRSELAIPTESIAITIADEVGLTDTSPTPDAEAATSVAPDIGEITPPEPVEVPQPDPTPAPPAPAQAPASKPAVTVKPTPPRQTQRPAPKPREQPKPRGSRLGDNFLSGVSDETSLSKSQTPAAREAGPAVVASLQREIARKLKPRWRAPSGVDVELLVTKVSWELNENGRVIGRPNCTNQSGINTSNRPQAELHCERARKAVLDAQPFDTLPKEFYSVWRSVAFEFDRKL